MKNILQAPIFYLSSAIGASDTSIGVKGFKDSRGNYITAMPSGVTELVATIEPRSLNNQEIISFTGITNIGNGFVTLTGVTRNLSPTDATVVLTPAVSHANNAECVLSDSPQAMDKILVTDEPATITAVHTFGASPVVPVGVNPTDAVNKSQLDATVAGTVPSSSTTTNGSVRMASSQIKTLGTVTMTIASPAVFTLNSHGLILNDTVTFTTTSALPTGIVAGTTYFVMSTGLTTNTFQLSATLSGTAITTTGSQSGTHTLYRTTPYAVNDQDGRLPTQSENDAMVGTSGTPSSSNKFVTNDDTATSSTASKVVRTKSDGTIDSSFLSGLVKFGGTGADGALSVSSGNTNIDLGGALFVVKNYTSISITGTGSVTFINPNSAGTLIFLKSQGSVTLTSSATPMLDASGCGTAGGAFATNAGTATAGTDITQTLAIYSTTSNSGGRPATGGANGGASTAIANPSFYGATLRATALGNERLPVVLVPGAGGGGGSSNNNPSAPGVAGSGGNGGGALYIECAGALNFTTVNGISVAGKNGTNASGSTNNAGGGGGGAPGMFLCIYNTLTANSGSVNTSAGTGGTALGGVGTAFGGGGGASAGNAGSAGSAGAGGNGGTAITNASLFIKNVSV